MGLGAQGIRDIGRFTNICSRMVLGRTELSDVFPLCLAGHSICVARALTEPLRIGARIVKR